MTAAGRNDPCPCGSGRKFKKCCLGKDGAAARPFTSGDRNGALTRLSRFAAHPEFRGEHEAARLAFWGDRLEGQREDRVEELLALEQCEYAYVMWFVFDRALERGRTLADLFLEREAATLTAGEREYLARMRPAHLRLYEVVEVRQDEGLGLVDLWTDDRVWVRERRATRQLVRWDLLATRVMPGADGDPVMDGAPYLYPALEKEGILKALRGAHRDFARRFPGEDLAAFFRWAGVLFHHLWLDHVALRPRPTIVTAEGDRVVFAKVIFDVRDRAALVAALAGHPDLDEQDDGSYAWHEPEDARGFRRGLGTFVLEGDRLAFETTSRPRAERGRRFLEGLAGDAVGFRATRYQDVEQALKKPPPPPDPRQAEIPPELQAQVAAEYYERHYRSWPDTALPALGNRTPRRAARLKTVRPRLVALLKDMESHSERERRAGRVAYDFAWMWAELGLERPE